MGSAPVLVTGGAGFIGSHLAVALLRQGYSVTVLDDLSGGFKENIPSDADFVQGSILDDRLLTRLFDAKRFAYVFHFAAYAAEGLSYFIRRYNYETNLLGTVNLINCSVQHEVRRFVFASSIAVYGNPAAPLDENTIPCPVDPYGVSKYAVELDLRSAYDTFGLPYTIFRPHNVYGERQNIGDCYRNVVGIFMNQWLRGEPLTIFGDGLQTRAFTYIDDIIPALVRCLEMPETVGEAFNIGADHVCTANELAGLVMRAMGKKTAVCHAEPRHEVTHLEPIHGKVKKFFPELSTSTGLKEGLARMAKWAKAHGAQESSLPVKLEIRHKLPRHWSLQLQ